MGYEALTAVQAQVIPLVFEKRDVIVQAQTGSGKTAAFAIPVCEQITLEQRNPQVLVLTPTRELAVQVKQDIANIGRFRKIRCAAVFGQQPMAQQRQVLSQRVHVIVGTPGRTLDHIESGSINPAQINYLILDEVDKMLDMGFSDQVTAIIDKLPGNRVTLVFSATMPEQIRQLCGKYMSNPVEVLIEPAGPAAAAIQQGWYAVEESGKFNLLQQIVATERPDSCILFCNTRGKADLLAAACSKAGYLCGVLHGGMAQKERLTAMQGFKRGEFRFLIATDVAARGIHVAEIALVINYDVPMDNESYVHRIGRTGRAGKDGRAITFVTVADRGALRAIEEFVQYAIPRLEPPASTDVEQGRLILENTRAQAAIKPDMADRLNSEITRIRINAGKKAKMRPGDILGACTAIDGVSAGDVGIIDVQQTCSYVEILNNKGSLVVAALQTVKIKGKVHTIKQVNFRSD